MGKKHVHNAKFYIGKGYPPMDIGHVPNVGFPCTNIDVYDKKTGNMVRHRKLNSAGKAYKDLDRKDPPKHYNDHVHDFQGSIRKLGREPNKKEVKEFEKMSKKRKGWKK